MPFDISALLERFLSSKGLWCFDFYECCTDFFGLLLKGSFLGKLDNTTFKAKMSCY